MNWSLRGSVAVLMTAIWLATNCHAQVKSVQPDKTYDQAIDLVVDSLVTFERDIPEAKRIAQQAVLAFVGLELEEETRLVEDLRDFYRDLLVGHPDFVGKDCFDYHPTVKTNSDIHALHWLLRLMVQQHRMRPNGDLVSECCKELAIACEVDIDDRLKRWCLKYLLCSSPLDQGFGGRRTRLLQEYGKLVAKLDNSEGERLAWQIAQWSSDSDFDWLSTTVEEVKSELRQLSELFLLDCVRRIQYSVAVRTFYDAFPKRFRETIVQCYRGAILEAQSRGGGSLELSGRMLLAEQLVWLGKPFEAEEVLDPVKNLRCWGSLEPSEQLRIQRQFEVIVGQQKLNVKDEADARQLYEKQKRIKELVDSEKHQLESQIYFKGMQDRDQLCLASIKINANEVRLQQVIGAVEETVGKELKDADAIREATETLGEYNEQIKTSKTELAKALNSLDSANTELAAKQSEVNSLQRVAASAWATAACLALIGGLFGGLMFVRQGKLRAQQNLNEERQRNAELQLKLARHRRMESLGLMAGSVAHDFNNILVGVSGNAELIELAADKGMFQQELVLGRVKAIQEASSRAQQLARQMLDYAGKRYIEQRNLDLNDIVSDNREVIRSLGPKHKFTFELCDYPIHAKVDRTQISQVIINLAKNAVDASGDGSTIAVRTGSDNLDADDLQHASYFGTRQRGGEYAWIEVEDHGCGIDSEKLEKIFEPFYTSNETGRGLGLAVVYGAVESHGGLVHCQSKAGRGTTFRILLPMIDSADADSIDDYLPQGVSVEETIEGTRVLIIDDEAGVIDTCQDFLEEYHVQSEGVTSGEDGMELLISNSDQTFDCLLMDVVMPGKTGNEILSWLETKGFDIPVVLMSGFSPERLDSYLKRPNVVAILPKPFGMRELKDAIAIARLKSDQLNADFDAQRVIPPMLDEESANS